MMKKLICIALSALLILSLAGCAGNADITDNTKDGTLGDKTTDNSMMGDLKKDANDMKDDAARGLDDMKRDVTNDLDTRSTGSGANGQDSDTDLVNGTMGGNNNVVNNSDGSVTHNGKTYDNGNVFGIDRPEN